MNKAFTQGSLCRVGFEASNGKVSVSVVLETRVMTSGLTLL